MVDRSEIIELLVCFLSELLGTALIFFLDCKSSLRILSTFLTHCGLSWGLAVMIVVKIFGCGSGSHVNPVVTIVAAFFKLVDIPATIEYIIPQILGSLIDYGMMFELLPDLYVQSYLVKPVEPVETVQTVLMEIIITLIFLVIVCYAVWNAGNTENTNSAVIRIGMTAICLYLAVGVVTGARLSPARALPLAVYNGKFKDHWIYWVASIIAGILTPLLYKFVFGTYSGRAAAE